MAQVPPAHAAWMRQWRETAHALAAERRARLAALTAEQARAASQAVLSLAVSVPLDPSRRLSSGLVEQQALFHRSAR